MIQGLDWVSENIAAFGGDNGNVTIAGNSAGCFGVWDLLQSPLADDLYHKALCSSGFPSACPAELGQGYSDGVIDQQLIFNGDATTPEMNDWGVNSLITIRIILEDTKKGGRYSP